MPGKREERDFPRHRRGVRLRHQLNRIAISSQLKNGYLTGGNNNLDFRLGQEPKVCIKRKNPILENGITSGPPYGFGIVPLISLIGV